MECSILSYHADPTGQILSSPAIQAAIDACAQNGGGRVVVPAGTYIIGTLWLRSHVELHLCHGAILKASANLDDYNEEDAYPQNYGCKAEEWNGKHLIIAHECEDVAITGTGIIDGSGHEFYAPPIPWTPYCWWEGLKLAKDKVALRPGQMLVFFECRGVTVHDITLRNSTCWNCYLHGCSHVQLRGMKIFNARNAANSDGIDIDTCRYVTVSDCIIDTGDDAIAIRCCGDRVLHSVPVCEYITITNCVLSSASSVFRIGVGQGTIQHVRVNNITMGCGSVGMMFMGYWTPDKCTNIYDVHFANISATNLAHPFQIHGGGDANFDGISIENYSAQAFGMTSVCTDRFGGVKNIRLKDIHISLADHPAASTKRDFEERGDLLFYCACADGVQLDNVYIDRSKLDMSLWRDTELIENCSRISGAVSFSE